MPTVYCPVARFCFLRQLQQLSLWSRLWGASAKAKLALRHSRTADKDKDFQFIAHTHIGAEASNIAAKTRHQQNGKKKGSPTLQLPYDDKSAHLKAAFAQETCLVFGCHVHPSTAEPLEPPLEASEMVSVVPYTDHATGLCSRVNMALAADSPKPYAEAMRGVRAAAAEQRGRVRVWGLGSGYNVWERN